MLAGSDRNYRFVPLASSGFTLLEMMVTVALIAITATFVGLNINQSDDQVVALEAKRFIALLNMAQDESIISGRPILLNVDAEARSYQFAPMEGSALFLDMLNSAGGSPGTEGDEAEAEGTYDPGADRFYEPRSFPEMLTIQFTRLPDPPERKVSTTLVPKRVHEILNQSLFDRDDDVLDPVEDEYAVVIEPNGLTSPFTLSLGIEGHSISVGLDRFGRAALVENP